VTFSIRYLSEGELLEAQQQPASSASGGALQSPQRNFYVWKDPPQMTQSTHQSEFKGKQTL
jgi:hypothetical protein